MPVTLTIRGAFFASYACTSRQHCSACRDTGPYGQRIRRDWAGIFKLPDADFECPHGKPWGDATPAPSPMTREQAEAIERENTAKYHALWRELHTKTDGDQAWLDGFAERIGCCSCHGHWVEMLKQTPPVFGDGFFAWTVDRHNEVNRRLGKPEVTLSDATALWRDKISG